MYPTILEVSFICLLGIAVIGKIGRHVRFPPPKKKKKKKIKTHHTDNTEAQAWTQEGPQGLGPDVVWAIILVHITRNCHTSQTCSRHHRHHSTAPG